MSFSYDDFRKTDELRAEWGRMLRSDVGKMVMRVMRDKYRPQDVPSDVDALASARVLSQYHGAFSCLDDLESLALPLGPNVQLDATYLASESDHDRMPSENETRGIVRPPPFLQP